MGYNRCIIAKATQILGDDRSKIMGNLNLSKSKQARIYLDYLNAYSVLIEKGYPSGKVLQVLQICENSLEESKIFFEKSPKYIEMGFELTAIRKALIRYPNEPRLQLESLVQGRTWKAAFICFYWKFIFLKSLTDMLKLRLFHLHRVSLLARHLFNKYSHNEFKLFLSSDCVSHLRQDS